MKNFSFAKKALLAAIVFAAASANAATFALGAPTPGSPLSFNNSANPAAPGGFSDSFTFTLPANGGSGYSVINFPLSFGAFTFSTSFTSLTLSSSGADMMPFTTDDTVLSTVASLGTGTLGMTFGPSAIGPMYLTVGGIALGSGGLYNGSISVSAVPEPESYAVLLAGLGVMGAIAMRRNKSKKRLA